MPESIIHYFIILLLLVIIGLCIYIAMTVKKTKEHVPAPIPAAMAKMLKNYKLMPGDGFDIRAGGDPSQINVTDCNSCLQNAAYDPSDPSVNSDPAYYYDGTCHYSEEGMAPQKGTTIAVNGIQNTKFNGFTCTSPGKVL